MHEGDVAVLKSLGIADKVGLAVVSTRMCKLLDWIASQSFIKQVIILPKQIAYTSIKASNE